MTTDVNFMATLILLNKPFQVLSQFKDEAERTTLAQFIKTKGVYPAGRLDYDSEGLLLLTDHGGLQHRIAHPDKKLDKTYWVQVEGLVDEESLVKLRTGIELKDGRTKPAKARLMDEPAHLWPRTPPIRDRASIPTQWLELIIREGKNRQVRRMTAAIGHPTLRLIRAQIGEWKLEQLQPGESRHLHVNMPQSTKKTTKHTFDTQKTKQGRWTKNTRGSNSYSRKNRGDK